MIMAKAEKDEAHCDRHNRCPSEHSTMRAAPSFEDRFKGLPWIDGHFTAVQPHRVLYAIGRLMTFKDTYDSLRPQPLTRPQYPSEEELAEL